ncbi:MAG: hypothetical protein U0871_07920 [Gemmataceae bacterium]
MSAVLAIVFAAGFPADPPPTDPAARQLVERALAGIGGKGKLDAMKAGVWATNGTVRGNPSRAEFKGELPGKFRIDSTRQIDGRPVRYSRIVDGDRGWVVEGEKARPMSADELAGVRTSFWHKQATTTLLPLLEKDVALARVPAAVVNGKTVAGVRAVRPGFPPLDVYFDPDSGLVARSVMTDPAAAAGRPKVVELVYEGHKEFDGVKMPARTKTYHDGKLFLETELTDFKRSAGLPPGTFDKP